jgi:hypothetical protein
MTVESSIMPSTYTGTCLLWTNGKEEVGHFSLVGKMTYSSCRSRETNEFSLSHWLYERFLTGITESFPTFNHTTSWTATCAPGECATTAHECSRGIVRGRYCVGIRVWTHQLVLVLGLFKKCANFMTYQLVPVLDFFKSFTLAWYWLDLLKSIHTNVELVFYRPCIPRQG